MFLVMPMDMHTYIATEPFVIHSHILRKREDLYIHLLYLESFPHHKIDSWPSCWDTPCNEPKNYEKSDMKVGHVSIKILDIANYGGQIVHCQYICTSVTTP